MWLWLCALPLVFVVPLVSDACFTEERIALLQISDSLRGMSTMGWLDTDDCCSWESVTCSNDTRRVSSLQLSLNGVPPEPESDPCSVKLNSTVFSAFPELQFLDFSMNHVLFQGSDGLVGLSKLRHLDLSYNCFDASFMESLGKLVPLEVLHLESTAMVGALPASVFENFRDMKDLDLSNNQLTGNLPASLFTLPRIEHLNVSRNLFEGISWSSTSGLVGLSKLRYVDLSYNCFNASYMESLRKLVSLEVLHLEFTAMVGALPASVFENLRDLKELDLSNNQLTGNLPVSLFTLPRIEHLNVSQNLFEGSIPWSSRSNISSSLRMLDISMNKLSGNFSFLWLRNLRNLEKIDLSGNVDLAIGVNFPGWTPPFQLKELLLSGCDTDKTIFAQPHFLRTQNYLEVLDLSNNSLSGSFPSWLFAPQSTLVYLNLRNNLLSGSLDHIKSTQTNLLAISLSSNNISGHLPANISSIFPNAAFLDFSGNTISGEIPSDLCNISSLEYLDLSYNNLSGELPSCLFADHPILKTLKLSNNKLGGPILGGKSHLSIRWEIYLDGNNFEGELPRYLTGNFEFQGTMDFHGNKLSGKLNVSLWFLPNLGTLNLASNSLTGELDPSICSLTSINLLDISNNNISGSLPNCNNPLALLFLNMSGNLLSGDVAPHAFFSNATVTALDLSYNQFTGNIDWIQTLGTVRYISLGRNKFNGQISPKLCVLQYLRIIDLSDNQLSGSLPPCIGDLSFQGTSSGLPYWALPCGRGFQYPAFRYTSCYEQSGFRFFTKYNLYTYRRNFIDLFFGFDFSYNKLSGEIPPELGHLTNLKALNLSHNNFVGKIPESLANMSEIESLDLSHNELSGAIPRQLSHLSSLAVFSVAYNNLSGCVPDVGQLSSFNMTSFEGNRDLREASPGSDCTAGSSPDGPSPWQPGSKEAKDPALYAVGAASFVLSFWITVGFIFCHSYGQRMVLKL
ncbi:unnamed protein product [Urochloa decumbens]|uniref:Leucine-rich repeat-containing N-terminal plant-type domain-containing protein n=1 Tax=Urochloa decumbens TaxID=240449 RepID=A0ABC9D0V6_9POAL